MGEKQIQRFALNAGGNVIDIRELTDRKGMFLCPSCKKPMIAKMGEIREWHFAHKSDVCAYDSYLHSLAKIRIADWFEKSEAIILEMNTIEICASHKNCPFYDFSFCSRPSIITHDLKQYYPTCETERSYGGFVADIFCPHKKSPLFIEIFVTHECSEDKKKSGEHIIKFVVDSEESIENIISSPKIKEGGNVRLYGFKRTEKTCGNFGRPLMKYILYQSRKSFVCEEGIDCKNYRHRRSNVIFEVTSTLQDPIFMHLAGKSMAPREGYLPKDCSICFWLGGEVGYRICKLHKRCGNPMWCKDNDASKCRMFKENRELIEECLEMGKEWTCEIWRSEICVGGTI